MLNSIINSITQSIQVGSLTAFVLVFVGGVVTSISPCILSMIPVLIGFIGGYGQTSKLKGFTLSLTFVVGMSITFAALGLVASSLGLVFGQIGSTWYYILSAIAIIMGLNLLGVLNFQFPQMQMVPPKMKGPLGAFVVGLLFGLVASPCATPVLAVILAFVATKGDIAYGSGLLFTYGMGHGLPLLVIGTFTAMVKEISKVQKYTHYVTQFSGALLVIIGLYLLYIA